MNVQELHKYQQDFYKQICNKFYYIYQTEDQSIYDEYQHIKQNIDCLLKEKEQVLKMQLQTNYDMTALMQDMLAQLMINDVILFFVQSCLISVKYVFKKNACIAQIFFNSSLFIKCNKNLNQQIFIVNDLISLCTH